MAIRNAEKPKHKRIFDDLGHAIQKGDFVPGQRLPTEVELMHQYGVSRTTVIRTLRDLEHRGVIWRRRGSGTFVKEIQPTLTEKFGMMVHGVEPGSIFLSVYESLSRALDRDGVHILLTHLNALDHMTEEAADSASRMVDRGVSGVFFLPHSISGEGEPLNRRVTELFDRAGVPVVLLDRDICNFPQRSNYDLITVDNLRGGYLIGQHLIDMGCRRALFFSENVTFPSARARWIGFRAAMENAGIQPRSFGCDPESTQEVLRMVQEHHPDGIACDNDRHAAILMRHLLNAKIEIPAQIKLAGFDDTPTASLLTVPLTTVRQPARAIALRALSVMNDRLAHPHLPPVQAVVHCELVIRESTAGASALSKGRNDSREVV